MARMTNKQMQDRIEYLEQDNKEMRDKINAVRTMVGWPTRATLSLASGSSIQNLGLFEGVEQLIHSLQEAKKSSVEKGTELGSLHCELNMIKKLIAEGIIAVAADKIEPVITDGTRGCM